MNAGTREWRWARRLAAAAGAMDFLTGAGLVFAPGLTLGAMGIAPPAGPALVFLRWVGVFVALVGATYLWALFRGGAERLALALELTLGYRAAVGAFVLAMWGRGALAPAWLAVTATDWAVAAGQGWLLGRSRGRAGA